MKRASRHSDPHVFVNQALAMSVEPTREAKHPSAPPCTSANRFPPRAVPAVRFLDDFVVEDGLGAHELPVAATSP